MAQISVDDLVLCTLLNAHRWKRFPRRFSIVKLLALFGVHLKKHKDLIVSEDLDIRIRGASAYFLTSDSAPCHHSHIRIRLKRLSSEKKRTYRRPHASPPSPRLGIPGDGTFSQAFPASGRVADGTTRPQSCTYKILAPVRC